MVAAVAASRVGGAKQLLLAAQALGHWGTGHGHSHGDVPSVAHVLCWSYRAHWSQRAQQSNVVQAMLEAAEAPVGVHKRPGYLASKVELAAGVHKQP